MYIGITPGKHVWVCWETSSCHSVFTYYVVTSTMHKPLCLCNVSNYVPVYLTVNLVLHRKIQYIFWNVDVPVSCVYLCTSAQGCAPSTMCKATLMCKNPVAPHVMYAYATSSIFDALRSSAIYIVPNLSLALQTTVYISMTVNPS